MGKILSREGGADHAVWWGWEYENSAAGICSGSAEIYLAQEIISAPTV